MTRDVSDQYAAFAAGQHAGAFAADSPYGGDHDAVRSGQIDAGRMELHQAVERELAAAGGSYEQALERTLAQAGSGVLALSQAALAGTGIGAAPAAPMPASTRAGRAPDGVLALSGGPVADPAPGPLDDPRDAARFADAVSYCAGDPSTGGLDHHDARLALLRRTDGATSEALITRFAAQGGAQAAGVRAMVQ